MSNLVRELFSEKPTTEYYETVISALTYNIEKQCCSTCIHYWYYQHLSEFAGMCTGIDEYCDMGQTPIATCRDYEPNPEIEIKLEELKKEYDLYLYGPPAVLVRGIDACKRHGLELDPTFVFPDVNITIVGGEGEPIKYEF